MRLFVKKPSAAPKSILRPSEGESDTIILRTDLFILWEETTGRIITAPDEVVAKIAQMETVVLSPDPTLPPSARRRRPRYR